MQCNVVHSNTAAMHFSATSNIIQSRSASWSSGKAFVSGVGGLRFKSRAGLIGYSVARCDISLKEAELLWCNDAVMGPTNSLHASA